MSIILIWSIFTISVKIRFLIDYIRCMNKKWFESSTWPQEHRAEPMMFLRNISLFSLRLCSNLVCTCMIYSNFTVSSWKIRWWFGTVFVYTSFKLVKEVASLASICNKVHWLIISGTQSFLKTCSLHFVMEYSLFYVYCIL